MALTDQGFWYPTKDDQMAPLHTNLATLASSINTKWKESLIPVSVTSTFEITALAINTPFYNTTTKEFGVKTAAAAVAGYKKYLVDVTGARVWSKAQDLPHNVPYGLGELAGSEQSAGSYGPAPATTSFEDLVISEAGIYTIGISFYAPGAVAGSYLRVTWPWARPEDDFNSNFVAQVSQTGYLAKSAVIHFEVMQNSGITRTCGFTLNIVRHS